MSTVLVTGGTGFVGSHAVAELLKQGHSVRTTVRNLSRRRDVLDMMKAAGVPDASRLLFYAADLEKDEGWGEAVDGCDYVLHVASPFPGKEPKDAEEIIRPAKEGALRVLRFGRDARVKRVVMTSSFAAIGYGHPQREKPFTEEDWTNVNAPLPAYIKSKAIAERAAWDFIHSDGKGLELSVVNPTGDLRTSPWEGLFFIDRNRKRNVGRQDAWLPTHLLRSRRCARRGRSSSPRDVQPRGSGGTIHRGGGSTIVDAAGRARHSRESRPQGGQGSDQAAAGLARAHHGPLQSNRKKNGGRVGQSARGLQQKGKTLTRLVSEIERRGRGCIRRDLTGFTGVGPGESFVCNASSRRYERVRHSRRDQRYRVGADMSAFHQ